MKIFKQKKYRMLATMAKYGFVFIIVFSVLMPFTFVMAKPGVDCNGTATNGSALPSCDANGNPVTSSSSTTNITVNTTITNPLGNGINDIPSFIEAILNIVLVVGVPIVTLAIIYAGFLFVKARGNPEELTKAKKTLMYTLIGAALLLGAFVIANAIKGTVDQIKSNS